MNMALRWFGTGFDTVTLESIRQIAGVDGVVTTLYDMAAGELWPVERIRAIRAEVEAAGLRILGIESVNIHDAIKIGLPERDQYIENYIETLKRLAAEDIRMVCYNFMPVFDWTRSALTKPRPDGSTVLAYDQREVDLIDPATIFDRMEASAGGFVLPGWEPERMARIRELFEQYKDVDEESLFRNLVYFLNAIMPTCEKYGVKMAIHPDDPSWSVFGLPRIITGGGKIRAMLDTVPSLYNGVTLCTGSLGSNPENDIPAIIRSLEGRIHFAHVRNLKHESPRVFEEAAHLSRDGSMDMHAILKALYGIGFNGVIRPDHGRMIWGEVAMPGYGLYDRALGASYLLGLWEGIVKADCGVRNAE